MNLLSLKATTLELTEKLDRYYDIKLMKEPRARINLETHKDDLLQNLYEELWTNYSKAVYQCYSVEAFIWFKAEKVWITFIRSLYKQSSRRGGVSIEDMVENRTVADFREEFESRQVLTVIKNNLDENEIRLIELRGQGFSYEEIKKIAGYPTANAAKTKFNRIKALIQQRFRKF